MQAAGAIITLVINEIITGHAAWQLRHRRVRPRRVQRDRAILFGQRSGNALQRVTGFQTLDDFEKRQLALPDNHGVDVRTFQSLLRQN